MCIDGARRSPSTFYMPPKIISVAAVVVGFFTANLASSQEPPPDAVFYGGKVVTVDPAFNLREAFAVRGGRIVGVGTNAEMRALARGSATQQHDLGGKMVLPGLIDSHVHAPAAAM